MKRTRKIRNFLINPIIQFRLSGYVVALVGVFCLILLGYTYFSINEFYHTLIDLTDIAEDVQAVAFDELLSLAIGLGIIAIAFFVFLAIVIVIETHKTVGAAYAINSHIRNKMLNGDFEQHLYLRKNDFLKEIAENLNSLSDKLNKKN